MEPGTGPEPDEESPSQPGGPDAATTTVCVPVRVTNGVDCVRLARLGNGERVALEFSSPERLHAAMGPRQQWIRMAEPALRALVRPLGVTRIQSDPSVVATPARAPRSRPASCPLNRRPVGAATRRARRA
ncbi:hypothetical protein CDO52_13385 [Nocardiopsis gilva YIM 90087]|uniref:Uncharacterized protein n=1 Tax=Nocardiopsis gilva YIM 90087 TaxID=1235441 RepID=A0A223S6A1_9ACTN|nr:SAV_915 family protein [Nocardiopsis gilva]ASU83650.1 hypothetical protein CDO52_13385 [Nocardiopsis gilva YIM 90087]